MHPAQKMTEYLANINRIQGAENCKGGACGATGGIQIPNRSKEGTYSECLVQLTDPDP